MKRMIKNAMQNTEETNKKELNEESEDKGKVATAARVSIKRSRV